MKVLKRLLEQKKMLAVFLLLLVVLLTPKYTVMVSAASNPYLTSQDVDGDGNYEIPCTWFAWQQAYDTLGIELPGWGHAVNWYSAAQSAGMSVGSTPKVNSIAVWSGDKYGHVAYVTGVSGTNTFTVNEGGRTDLDNTDSHGIKYGYTLTNAVGAARPYDSGKTLLGFIYLETHTHSWNSGVVTQQATCQSTGVKTYTCTSCGGTKTETIEMTSHSYEWVIDVEADYGVEGSKHQECTVCGQQGTTETTSALVDTTSPTAKKAEYYLGNGIIEWDLTEVEDASPTKVHIEIPAKYMASGEDYTYDTDFEKRSEYVVTFDTNLLKDSTDASYTWRLIDKSGNYTRFDGDTYCGNISQLSVVEMVVGETCEMHKIPEKPGIDDFYSWVIVDGKENCVSENNGYFTAIREGECVIAACYNKTGGITKPRIIKVVSSHTHTWDSGVITTQATCQQSGVITYTCATCGETKTEATEKGEHKSATDSAVAATCTTAGKTEGSHCSVCGTVISAQSEIPATGHNWGDFKVVSENLKERSCLSCGTVEQQTFTTEAPTTVTTEESTETTTKSKHVHVTEIQNAKKATMGTTGYSGDEVCTICGKTVKHGSCIWEVGLVNLSASKYIYDGTEKKPTVTLKDWWGKDISESNYEVSYSSNCKDIGEYEVIVTLKGDYSGTTTRTFQIVPEGTSIKKVSGGKKKITVSWKKQKNQTTGYEIQYSTSKRFKNASTKYIKKNSKTKLTIKNLKSKKKYYVRIRTYKTVNGKKYYSSWSEVKTVKVK